MNPQTFATIHEQTKFAQLSEVARNVWLRRANRVGEFANAQIIVPHQQHDATQAGFMGQSREQTWCGYIHSTEYMGYAIYRQSNI